MFNLEYRISVGKSVKDIAWHYFAGLKGISIKDAQKEFEKELTRGDLLAASALRMAEREVLSPEFK